MRFLTRLRPHLALVALGAVALLICFGLVRWGWYEYTQASWRNARAVKAEQEADALIRDVAAQQEQADKALKR